MPDFKTRSTLPEKMDDPNVIVTEVVQALNELETINRWLGGYSVVLGAFKKITKKHRALSVIDMGCGGGDTLRKIADVAVKKGVDIKLMGIDWNPVMTGFAKSKSKNYNNINYKTISIWDDRLKQEKADVTMNSLFCHHFDDDDLVKLIMRMYELAEKYVVINDLHRHWFAYYSIKYITAFFSKTFLVRYDAPLSVARSLTRSEWKEILSRAGISNYQIKWMWAWRWQIIIEKN